MSLDEMIERSALMPDVIAECVLRQRGVQMDGFIETASARALRCYSNNTRFRNLLDGADGRYWLYRFTNHWLDAALERQRRSL